MDGTAHVRAARMGAALCRGLACRSSGARAIAAAAIRAAIIAGPADPAATAALKKLPNTRVVEGRQVCETAPNGSPDCQAAAEVICKGKGFATGKSADITTSRKCSARGLLQRDESECRTETVVIKAACQ